MNDDEKLEKLRKKAKSMTRSEFQRAYGGFYFMGEYPPDVDDDSEFATGLVTAESLLKGDARGSIRAGISARPRPFVLEIRKKDANAWLRWISVGRASNNDLVVRHHTISKLHARIERKEGAVGSGGEGSPYTLADAGSTNGTWVNDQRLMSPATHTLAPGDRVLMGEVECHFLDADLLYDRLRRIVPTLTGMPNPFADSDF